MNNELEVTLLAGTKYTVELPEGTQSETMALGQDSKAALLFMTDYWHIYNMNGTVVYVRAEDDI
jgi:hypothetical protein